MNELLDDTLLPLLAAWLLLATAALFSHQQQLGLSKAMLWSSLRGLLQLLLLAWLLQWIFAIHTTLLQALLIAGFCLLAGHNSASHGDQSWQLWLACSTGLIAGCSVTLPWLVWSGAIDADSRHLIPLGSMVAANGMNAISLMLVRMQSNQTKQHNFGEGIRAAMIPPIDTLKVVGLVHMPGIFVGMVLAGSTALAAATAQLVILYTIIASGLTACCITLLLYNHWRKSC
ncbi:MAG: ABC transporter permease [Mariprofundaceae bacterium]|nr:ABC transporter permease [Mariprofundaceae bacterium]